MQQKKKTPKKQKPHIPLLELIAINNTAKAREYLKKNNIEDALSYADLEDKLAVLYQDSKDKVAVEFAFAELHPHKDFILKYLAPPPTKTKVIIPENKASMEGMYGGEALSNCEGNPNCNCNKMKTSNADGVEVVALKPVGEKTRFTSMELIAVVGIVAVVGMMYMHNQKVNR